MYRASEAVEEGRLYAPGREQLANIFQGVDGVLHGLSWEAVHQIGVYEDTRVRKGMCDAGHLLDRHAFLHEFEQAIRGHFQSAGDGDAAAFGQQSAKRRVEGLLETNVAPP